MKKILAVSLWISLLYGQGCVYSEESGTESNPCTQIGQECQPPCNTGNCIRAARIEFGGAFGDYIGIRQGYAEVGLFEMIEIPSDTYAFLEGRGFLLSNNDWVASLGAGIRKPLCACSPIIWGANVYYDYESSKFSKEEDCECCVLNSLRRSFGEVGVGFEILSECVDFRTNAYLPVRAERTTKSVFTYPEGHTARIKTTHYIQYGIDAEIGKRLDFCSGLYASGAAGGYTYFYKHTKGIYGPFARLEFGFGDYLSLQTRYSYDKHYHSSVQGKVLFSLPLDQLARCFDECCAICFDPLTQPVRRNYIPFVQQRCCWKWNW